MKDQPRRASKKRRKKTSKKPLQEPRRLTLSEIEALADKAKADEDEPDKYLALLLLVREIELVFLNNPTNMENVTRVIRDRIFCRSGDPMFVAEDKCINDYRRVFTGEAQS